MLKKAEKFPRASKSTVLHMGNGHLVNVRVEDGWLILTADSTLTVRPVDERSIYVRPVGYKGMWIPEFAKKGGDDS